MSNLSPILISTATEFRYLSNYSLCETSLVIHASQNLLLFLISYYFQHLGTTQPLSLFISQGRKKKEMEFTFFFSLIWMFIVRKHDFSYVDLQTQHITW